MDGNMRQLFEQTEIGGNMYLEPGNFEKETIHSQIVPLEQT